ncbi:hypothetical protein FRB93_010402 [Tulasnella sp. JGI-2019a]|nr:hypothetical protein FRB93_010402 [Tulasnella sp. JGI-2019a]
MIRAGTAVPSSLFNGVSTLHARDAAAASTTFHGSTSSIRNYSGGQDYKRYPGFSRDRDDRQSRPPSRRPERSGSTNVSHREALGEDEYNLRVEKGLCLQCGQPGHQSKDCRVRTCFKCHQQGHEAVNCPEFGQVVRSDMVCHICSEKGHMARDCSNRVCYNCNQPGHLASDCENEMTCRGCKQAGHSHRDCPTAPPRRNDRGGFEGRNDGLDRQPSRGFNGGRGADDAGAGKTLFVGNMPWSITEDQLSKKFADFGMVKSVRIPTDRETGKTKGFGYVEFESADDAKRALEQGGAAGSGIEFDGRTVNLDFPRPRPSTQSRGPRRDDRGGSGRYQSRERF